MQKYECQICGAELHWDPNVNALKCKYCDSEYQPSDFTDNTLNHNAENIQENLVDKEYSNNKSDLTDNMLVYKCTECGAEVVATDTTMATICAYCGRALNITNKNAGNFRPEQVIPFNVDKPKAIELLQNYFKKSILAPKQFSEKHTLEKVQGLYVPFFLHSMCMDSSGSIECTTKTSHKRGYDRVNTHKVYNVYMDTNGEFYDIPTDGSSKLDNALMDALEPFSYDKIRDFNPAYMAGYFAEQPDETASDTVDRAITRAEGIVEKQMVEKAGAYDTKSIGQVNHIKSRVDSKYVMLPVWLFNIEYNNKKYLFAVNGDTGKVVGEVPISSLKVLLRILTYFGISQLVSLLALFIF